MWLGPVGDFIDFDGNGLWSVWVCQRGCGGYGWLPWLRRGEWVVDLGCAGLLIRLLRLWLIGPAVLIFAVGLVGV